MAPARRHWGTLMNRTRKSRLGLAVVVTVLCAVVLGAGAGHAEQETPKQYLLEIEGMR